MPRQQERYLIRKVSCIYHKIQQNNILLFSDSSAVSASNLCSKTLMSSLRRFQYLLTTHSTASSCVCLFSSCSILARSSASHLCLCSILCCQKEHFIHKKRAMTESVVQCTWILYNQKHKTLSSNSDNVCFISGIALI